MLVDTDVVIWYLRGHDAAARLLDSLADLRLSAVTWMEFSDGVDPSRVALGASGPHSGPWCVGNAAGGFAASVSAQWRIALRASATR